MKRTIFVTLIFTKSLFAEPSNVVAAPKVASAIMNVREFIKNQFRMPATAQFSNETLCAQMRQADFEEAAGLAPAPECLVVSKPIGEGADAVVYRGSVDSQNYSGALVRSKFEVIVSFTKDGRWVFEDLATSVRYLYSSCLDRNSRALRDSTGRVAPVVFEPCGSEYPSATKQRLDYLARK